MRTVAVLLALVTLGVGALAGLEMALRLNPAALPEGAQLELQWYAPGQEDKTIAHPYVGFLYPSHSEGEIRHRDFGFRYETDENGFRNPWPWPARADIVIVGDSQVFGFGVEADQTWVNLLAASLPELRIVNLGLNGAAPQQSLRTYELFGAALKPKLILFVLFPAHGLNAVGRFERWLDAGQPETYETRTGGSSGIRETVRGLLRSSRLYLAARHTIANLVFGHWGQTIEFEGGRRLQLAPILNMDTYEHLDPDDPNFQLVLETIDRLRQLGEQAGAETLVLLIPTKEELHLPRLGIPTASTTEPFATALASMGIRHLDVTPHFRERIGAGERLFFERDVHPDADGYRLIADVVAHYLRTNTGSLGLADRGVAGRGRH